MGSGIPGQAGVLEGSLLNEVVRALRRWFRVADAPIGYLITLSSNQERMERVMGIEPTTFSLGTLLPAWLEIHAGQPTPPVSDG
jgi:hypothetical protein